MIGTSLVEDGKFDDDEDVKDRRGFLFVGCTCTTVVLFLDLHMKVRVCHKKESSLDHGRREHVGRFFFCFQFRVIRVHLGPEIYDT